MEKTWENFWTSGKVEDYLSYRNHLEEETKARKGERESKEDGTVGSSDGDGTFHHANF